jgi:two-component system, chemotaxis family, sensor kinase CheA
MPARPKATCKKPEANFSASSFDDALALVLQVDPDKTEDFARLSNVLGQVLADVPLDAQTGELVIAAKDQVDRHIRGESCDTEDVLIETSRLLEAAANARERALLHTSSSSAYITEQDTAAAKEPARMAPVQDVVSPDLDADLLNEFITESRELLDRSESALLALESKPEDAEDVNTVFRAFHTIKGTSGFLGLNLTSELAHLAESLLSRVRSKEIRLTGRHADLALRSIDMLKKAVASLEGAAKGTRLNVPSGFEALKSILLKPETEQLEEFTMPESDQDSQRGSSQETVPEARPTGARDAEYDLSIRVNTARLDRLTDLVGELVIAQSMVVQDPWLLEDHCHELLRKVTHAGKIVRELQDLSMSMRMVPLRGTFQKMQRLARDLARKSGKSVELIAEDGGTEIDRHMVAILSDALLHMVRNAIDHGIEAPNDREQRGKPPTGTVRLKASCSGGTVVVEISDDGRGLNREKILSEALAAGIADPDETLSDSEIFSFIFAPGLSTSDEVTDVSGRGVGMDVVRKGVESLHGRIEILTTSGAGSTFIIRLPLTLAITDGMLVRVGSERYLIPTVSIHLCFRPEPDSVSMVAGRGELVMLRGEMMPLFRLHRLFSIRPAVEDPTQGLLVVVGEGSKTGRCAILVDELIGQQQVVAKSLTKAVGKIPGISGGAILGDGQVGLILDTGELCQLVGTSTCQLTIDMPTASSQDAVREKETGGGW